ncbi:histidine kinase [Natronomonas moolapensis 8.8.11]|uniref:histidine kinase n=1 Tax=Natronomonas moolapensis (strain DSM 18674 / CECT 7526 / JCM 14361 / 8.8.11) TaxID=268739 RepID=M1XL84_NATM8|nr:HAMP domain-containing sensor histidine kinase [Natronomonas moolapensis]CCQ37262.1 histidine kinase [Natronomonas moolapensis 8.8.11]
MNDSDEGAADGEKTVSLETLPYPVARYTVTADTVVLDVANGPFRSAFGTDASASRLRAWWRENGLRANRGDPDAVCEALLDGGRTDLTVRAGDHTDSESTYRLSVVPDDDATTGTLTLLPAEPRSVPGGGSIGDHIASVVSHDLRNPLDVAKARARAARETGDTEHFDRLDRAHNRMERIISDVLTLARRDNVVDTTRDVGIADVVRDAWQAVETESAELTVAQSLPRTEADSDRLQRLFENLFRNAVEHGFTPGKAQAGDAVDGGPQGAAAASDADVAETGSDDGTAADDPALSVRVGPMAEGFFVADDGRGVPPAERERVFDPGYTVIGGGTGLGLTIVDRIATAHGWTVTVTESDAGGARFEVTGLA